MNSPATTDLFLRRSDGERALPDSAAPSGATDFAALSAALSAASRSFDPGRRHDVDHLSACLMGSTDDDHAEERCALLSTACSYYQRIGCSVDGIARGKAARELARRLGLDDLERLACNVLGTVYLDTANFDEACRCLERTMVLARERGDPFLVSLACSTTGTLFKEMGCYVDALAMIDRSLTPPIPTPEAEHVRFVSATDGLFCAHRLHDDEAALRYMATAAAAIDNPLIDIVTRASFEYHRAIHLLARDEGETAEMLVRAARVRTKTNRNARVEILLATAESLCHWASRVPARELFARRKLRELYHRSRQTRLYHDDVLRALMHVHGRPSSREDAEIGVAYAKELVEYTTSVKHAKFYRQMSDNAVPVRTSASPAAGVDDPDVVAFDPFANARRWLAADTFTPPPPPENGEHVPHRPADIRKHDELSAIHDDLATMRTASLKTSIGGVGYDMAENWALAAEFFDDQTGQHCFRVGRLAGLLAAELGMDADYCVRIERAARLHDIGKITVNELILLKPGPLDPGELTAMRAHAEVGGFLLQHSDDPTLKMAAMIARHHHEWWNGTGYPHSLAGERIPLEARICALADVYDALTNARPYKRAWPHRTSVEQITGEAGAHFDPRLLAPFMRVLERQLGSSPVPPSTQMYLRDMDANGLLVARRHLMASINDR